MQKRSRALPVILVAIFLDMVTNGILVPIVPQLLADPNSELYLLPLSVPTSYAYITLGLLLGIFPIFTFFATPILGEYSDYIGRRKVMTLSLIGSGIALALFAYGVVVKSLVILFIARIIGGIMCGNIAVAQAAIADITPPEKRSARFGLIGAAFGVGFIIGPVVGAVLSDSRILPWFTATTPFLAAAVLSLLTGLLVYLFMPETRFNEEKLKISWNAAVSHVLEAYNMKKIRFVFATSFLFQAGITLFATFFSVFLIHSFGYDQAAVGYYIAYAGLWIVISQGVILRFLAKRFDEVTLLRIFLFFGAISVFLYYLVDQTTGLLVVGALLALTNGISMATIPSLVSRLTSAKNQGEVLGINASVQALAQSVPPIMAGLLAAQITPAAPVYAAGAVIGFAWILFMIGVPKTS